MLRNDPFYHQTIYNLVVTFGDLFNDIYVSRKDINKNEVQRIKVPISYGPKEKWLVRADQDPDLTKQKAIILPRMGFELTTIDLDAARQFNKTYRISSQYSSQQRHYQYNPVPYNVHFSLYVITKNVEDGLQITEQIFPFFNPSWMVTITSVLDMNLHDDVPIVLDSVTQEDSYDGSFEQRRTTTWTINFIAKAYFYGPISTQKIIRKATTDFHIPSGADPVTDAEVANTPRVVRGESVPDPIDAIPEDDYGFLDTITEFDDGKKYDPVLGIDIPVGGRTVLLGASKITMYRNRPTVA